MLEVGTIIGGRLRVEQILGAGAPAPTQPGFDPARRGSQEGRRGADHHPETVGFQMSGPHLEQARTGCRASLKGAPKDMPGETVAMAYAQCYCIVGDLDHARKLLATITDKDMRQALRTACAMYGVTLK